jgi:hypothetical protein
MRQLSRRSVTTGALAAVAVIPAVGLGAKAAIAEPEDLIAQVRALARQFTAHPQNEPKLTLAEWRERKTIGRVLQALIGDEPTPWEDWESRE